MWDYGKEISVTLEDALYTPASQSLMWGGKFGTKHTKIYGAWNPYIYKKDRTGRPIYMNKEVVSVDPQDSSYFCFICPCDGEKKWAKFSPAEYETITDITGISKSFHNKNFDVYTYETLKNCFGKRENGTGLEKAEITIDTFGDFDFNSYITDTSSIWTKVSIDETTPVFCEPGADVYEYIWDNTDIKMSSLEGNFDAYYVENVSLKYWTEINGSAQEIFIAKNSLYNYSRPSAAGYYDTNRDTIGTIVTTYSDKDTQMSDDGINIRGIKYVAESFGKKIVLFLNFLWSFTDCNGEIAEHINKIPVGEFYIVEDWNYQIGSTQEWIYPINSGLEDVTTLERMEKCKAAQTFAINTDRNTKSANYRYIKKYDNTELVVYIDPKTMKPFEPNAETFLRRNCYEIKGNLRIIKQHEVYYKWTRTIAPDYTTLGHQIIVDAVHYPGVYRLVGETYARSRKDGKDQRYQFEIPLCKMSSETNLTLEAAGDPTTFTMNMRVLRREDGVMMKITQYNVDKAKYDGVDSGSTNVVPIDGVISTDPVYPEDDEVR